MLIGITGPAFSGKDTIANHLCWTHGYTCEAFADPLRDGLSSLFGLLPHHFDAKHNETIVEWIGKSPRELLQTLGTQWGRDLVNRQIWCRHMHRRLQEYELYGTPIAVYRIRLDKIGEARRVTQFVAA